MEAKNLVLLWGMPDALMLIIEHPSSVVYQNQVGGVTCWQGSMEGVLVPLDVRDSVRDQIQELHYPSGAEGISAELADAIDVILSSSGYGRHVKVDRSRINDCWEAWIYVDVQTSPFSHWQLGHSYMGAAYGWGLTKAVLTWPNSD